MRKSGGRRGIREVIGRDINRLYGGDGSVSGRGNALLQFAEIARQRRLIAGSRRHPSKQSGNLAAGLHKAENVINEKEHIFVAFIPEMFGHGKPGERHTHPHAGRFVHLAEDQCGFGQNAAFLHFKIEVTAFPAPLAHTGENRITAVFGGDVVDQFLNEHGLAHARATEKADLATLGIRGKQINHLNAGLQNLLGIASLGKAGSRAIYALPPGVLREGFAAVHRISQHIEKPPQYPFTHRYTDGMSAGRHFHTARNSFAGAHHNATHQIALQMFGHLHDAALVFHGQKQFFPDVRQCAVRKGNINHRPADRDHMTLLKFVLFRHFLPFPHPVRGCFLFVLVRRKLR